MHSRRTPPDSECWTVFLKAFIIEIATGPFELLEFMSPEPACLGLDKIMG